MNTLEARMQICCALNGSWTTIHRLTMSTNTCGGTKNGLQPTYSIYYSIYNKMAQGYRCEGGEVFYAPTEPEADG